MKILNAQTMRKELVGQVRHAKVYNNKASETPIAELQAVIKTEKWEGSAGREKLLNERRSAIQKLKNAATGYDAATIASLLSGFIIDLQRLADDLTIYTPKLVTEKVDEAAPETVKLHNYLPYVGKEGVIAGASDTVPLMEHNLPIEQVVTLQIKAFGDKTTLRELVLNPFYKTENVIQSAARINADGQNADFFKPVVSATYNAAHSQTFDSTGATRDLQIYNTVKSAILKALKLYNKANAKQNGLMAYEVYLLVNPLDLPEVEPVVNGSLARIAGVSQLVDRLPITAIVPYGGGLNDGLKYGSETLSYPGVASGTFYVLIKNDTYGGYKIIKRAPTMEMGEGDVLGLTTEKRAWHRIDGVFLDWILPSTSGGKDYGAIIKGVLS